MRGRLIAGAAIALVAVFFTLAVGYWVMQRDERRQESISSAVPPLDASLPLDRSFLYGHVTTTGGESYLGRLRFGGSEEAFWGDSFYGVKTENHWSAYVSPENLPKQSQPLEIFGFEVYRREIPLDLRRPFLARFGDIARIEASGRNARVTLKSGTSADLDRYEANDLDDGLRVWDGQQGVVDLESSEIKTIEFLRAPARGGANSGRLHGTVRTRQGEFSGFVQWNRHSGLATDTLNGESAAGTKSIRFGTIRSIARRSSDSSVLTLLDGREMTLSGSRESGDGNLGVYVDDSRYGRLLVSWGAFERIEFSRGGSGPSYDDYPPGVPIAGSVVTRAGRRLNGRLVFDLDESEVTETLDAAAEGVDYTIPFGLIASIALPEPNARSDGQAQVTLQSGEKLRLECAGDLSATNGGMLIFLDGVPDPVYVSWSNIERVEIERPLKMQPATNHETP